jgi:hypothetical protein
MTSAALRVFSRWLRRVLKLRALLFKEAAFKIFALLPDIERCYRAVIAHHARPHFAPLAFAVIEHDGVGFEMPLDHVVHVILLE